MKKQNLIEVLERNKENFHPILGNRIVQFKKIDLSLHQAYFKNKDLITFDDLAKCVQEQTNQHKYIGWGGYLEHRSIYRASGLFGATADDRCIHLGIDIWDEIGTIIHAPLTGRIHSFQYNSNPLDYGATVILEHELEGMKFYTLYGHLSLGSLKDKKEGQLIEQGTPFVALGNPQENGGWYAHLHFQIIKDMGDKKGDFAGVASQTEMTFYKECCPNPNLILGL